MPREEPFFRKCCYCIPLKSCLQVWSCVKSVVDISLAVFLTLLVIILADFHALETGHFSIAHMIFVIIVLLAIDSVFMVVLTVGLCTNDLRALRIFFYYSIYMVFMGATCFLSFIIYSILNINDIPFGVVLITVLVVCLLINAALDLCIIFTLKSEMIKLRNKQQYEFVQMPNLDGEEEEEKEPTEPFQADVEDLDV